MGKNLWAKRFWSISVGICWAKVVGMGRRGCEQSRGQMVGKRIVSKIVGRESWARLWAREWLGHWAMGIMAVSKK